ncbi:MAG: hypothetical protein COA58_14370 [Bacteroidetes bacterium]|nr:MAG: hypothetical protein COA58_14370 [Bacteroidota bacterium]
MKIISIIGLILFLVGCQQERECNLSEMLFAKPRNSNHIVDIENLWEYSDSMERVICKKGLNGLFLKVDNLYLSYSPVDLLNKCSSVTYCGPLKKGDRIEVLLNRENVVLFEGEVVAMEDLDSLFQMIYMNLEQKSEYIMKPSKSVITLKWDIEASHQEVKAIIKKLVKGYTSSIRSLHSISNSATAICDSVQINKERLAKEYPFRLSLHFGTHFTLGGRVPPPPPPPPFDLEVN